MKIPFTVSDSNWLLRTSNNGVSTNGFKRKRIGAWNKAQAWTGKPDCFICGGFFGIDPQYNAAGLYLDRPTIELCEWRGERVPIDGDKICVSEYRVVAINEDIPLTFLQVCGYKVASDGDTITPEPGDRYILLSGHVCVTGQVAGYWRAHGSSSQTVTGQEGGKWWAYGSSSQTVTGHKGGKWRAHGHSSQTVTR